MVNSAVHRSLGPFTFLSFMLYAAPAAAHGFGQRFDLPLPLWMWLSGAGATIVLTFGAMALFARNAKRSEHLWQLDLLRWPAMRWLVHPLLVRTLKAGGVALFVLALLAGFFGAQSPYANVLTTLFWVIWWVGCAFACALIGDVWSLLNPLRTLFAWAEFTHARLWGGSALSLQLPYPPRLGAWPAVLLFFAFAWAELIWHSNDVPFNLATALLCYAVLTWTGMFLFGREVWLRHGEAFAIVFGVLARFAPFAYVPASADGKPERLVLRPPGAGLLSREAVSTSMMVFVLLMLASVAFDGFKEIDAMQRIDTAAQSVRPIAVTLFELSEWGFDEVQTVHTVALLVFAFAFVAIFSATSHVMLRSVEHSAEADEALLPMSLRTGEVARTFVMTLVPIAVAYHLAHYFSLLLTAGQFIVPLASDPFGFGWNLFGTAGYKVDLALVSPYVFWYGSVVIIVIGHVVSVVLAHVVALRAFGSHQLALISQIPMVALMVAYTTLSLWILAQPIVA